MTHNKILDLYWLSTKQKRALKQQNQSIVAYQCSCIIYSTKSTTFGVLAHSEVGLFGEILSCLDFPKVSASRILSKFQHFNTPVVIEKLKFKIESRVKVKKLEFKSGSKIRVAGLELPNK